MGLAEAWSSAVTQGRWLIVEVAASWVPAGLSLGLREDQVAEFGLLTRVDLETEAVFLRAHQVESVPAVVVFLPSGEVHVTRGCITFERLRDWFVGIRANPTLADAVDWNSAGRLEALHRISATEHAARLLPELIAMWTTPDLMNVVERATSLVSLMTQACAASPVVHARFSAIRDAAKPVDGALKGWPDWLALNEVLAESHVTLAWFDDCIARNVRVRHWSRLKALVLHRGRASDYAYLHQDVRADIAEFFEDRDVAYEALNSSSAGVLRLAMALQVSAFAHVDPTSDLMEFVLTHDSSQEMQELLACSFDQLRLLFLK